MKAFTAWASISGARGITVTGNGISVRLAQANTDVGVPVMTSSKGYMLLWDNPAVTTISSGAAGDRTPARKSCAGHSEYGKAIDYYFCYGDGTIATAMKAYRHLTGEAPLMPEWELGFWQCKERYASQEELLGVAKNCANSKCPWTESFRTGNTGRRAPTPGDRISSTRRVIRIRSACSRNCTTMHYHALISVWAKFDLGSENSKELNAVGGMFPEITSYAFPPGHGQWYDPFAHRGPADLLEADARPAFRQGRGRLVAGCARAGNRRHGFPQLQDAAGTGLRSL